MIRHNLRIFFSAAKASFVVLSAEYTPALFVGTALPRYVLQAAFFVLLARFAGGPDLMRFALIGNIIQIAANMGIVGMSSTVEAEKWIGTLPLLIAVPSNKLPALLGHGVAETTMGVIGIAAAMLGCLLLFGPIFNPLNMLAALPLIFLVIVSINGLGLLIGAVTLPARIGTLATNTAAYLMMIVCGVNFPITSLPGWLQVISRLLPMTNGLLAIRQMVDGASTLDVLPLIGTEVALGAAYYALGYVAFEYHLRVARQKGTVELF